MPFTPSAFAQLIKPLDRRVIAGAVKRHDGDRGVGGGEHAWTCERHLKALLLAQLSGLDSLRQIAVGLAAQPGRFYHLNLRPAPRSTLSDANAKRPWQVFGDIAAGLVPLATGALRREGSALIRLLDSTPLPLKGRGFDWAEANSRTRGLKLHVLYDPREVRPLWFEVTSAKIEDVVAGRAAPLEAGAVYVFDKGYTDYGRWAQIIAAGGVFVTRRKRNACRRDLAEQQPVGAAILADRQLKIGHRQARGGAPKNPLFDTALREIVVMRPDNKEPLVLLTNDLASPAEQIARLYRERWEIELLFKWLKQNLQIRHFLGHSENAVRIQIYVALIAFMLLHILHGTLARSFKHSPTLLLARLRLALFDPLDLRNNTPPLPRPPAWRPATPQACFSFP